MANPTIIYQSRTGITLTDGYYLARNPRNRNVCVISIAQGLVCIHDITRQMNLPDLVQMDSIGYLDIYDQLEPVEQLKNKKKTKKSNEQ